MLVWFTSISVRMYINYVLRCLFELDLTLRDERVLVEQFTYYFFFMNFLNCAA